MKLLIAMILLFASMSFAADPAPKEQKLAPQSQGAFAEDLNKSRMPARTPQSTKQETTAERSGCCSHHNGVCGCSLGRQICCDGSQSPSCTCN